MVEVEVEREIGELDPERERDGGPDVAGHAGPALGVLECSGRDPGAQGEGLLGEAERLTASAQEAGIEAETRRSTGGSARL